MQFYLDDGYLDYYFDRYLNCFSNRYKQKIHRPESLQRICLDQICDCLREGAFESCAINLFLKIPPKVANELMEFIQTHHFRNPPKLRDVAPLLSSGRLTRFNLCPFDLKAEHEIMIRAINLTGSVTKQDLQSYSESLVALYHFRKIISQNPNLQELHLNIQPDFEIFRNCQNLEILRFHPPSRLHRIDYFFIDISVLSSLKHLTVLHIPDMDPNTMADVLDNCPNLISLGLADSLDAMLRIFQRMQDKSSSSFRTNKHFQLKRCVWGTDMKKNTSNIHSGWTKSQKKFRFPAKLKHGVSFCPLIEELIFKVSTKDSMKALQNLKKLTLLRLDFRDCKHKFLANFIELLQNIGPQLQHLSIICRRSVPLDVICVCCPHLQSLEIDGPTFLQNSTVDCSELPLLRLRLANWYRSNDKKNLLFLLPKCKHLLELFLENIHFLNNTLMKKIFDVNPFTELKVSCIKSCDLTMEVCDMFRFTPASIEVIDIYSFYGEYFYEEATDIFEDPNIFYKEHLQVKTKEFFYRKLNINRF